MAQTVKKVKSLSHFQLVVTLWTVASRQEYWSGLLFPSPGDLPDPGTEPRSPALEAVTLTSESPGKPMQENWFRFLGGEDPLEEGLVIHSSILAWTIPWTEESGELQSIGLHRVRHNWSDLAQHSTYKYIYKYIYIYIYTHIYTYMYTHTHTHSTERLHVLITERELRRKIYPY